MDNDMMAIVYSGFDTVIFAVKGALSPNAREHIEHTRLRALKEGAIQPLEYLEGPTGRECSPKWSERWLCLCSRYWPARRDFFF